MPRKQVLVITSFIYIIAGLFVGSTLVSHRTQETREGTRPSTTIESAVATDVEVAQKIRKVHPEIKPPKNEPKPPAPVVVVEELAPVRELLPQPEIPVVIDPVVLPPVIIVQPAPIPELPKNPPVCGGCGQNLQDNSLTIRCPMNDQSLSMICEVML